MKAPNQIKNIAASTRARLETLARMHGQPFQELLQNYFIERFLYRLSISPHEDRFVLKGALMLEVWGVSEGRPTKDIDLLGKTANDFDSIIQIISDVCNQRVEDDGVVFDASSARTEAISEDDLYNGVRVVFSTKLEKARTMVQVDIGFSDHVYPSPSKLPYPVILPNNAPVMRGYSKESFVAEKVEAMTKLGMINSRMKDIYDVWLLSRRFSFDGQILADAVHLTFHTRGTRVDPDTKVFQDMFAKDESKSRQWLAFVKRNRFPECPSTLEQVISELSIFIRPVLMALQTESSFPMSWNHVSGWS